MLSNEQIEKIWTWCGIRPEPIRLIKEQKEAGTVLTGAPPEYPPLDLNNLFKFAVPKLHYVVLKAGLVGKGYFSAKVSVGIKMDSYSGLVTDPAEALALAVLKVIEAGE